MTKRGEIALRRDHFRADKGQEGRKLYKSLSAAADRLFLCDPNVWDVFQYAYSGSAASRPPILPGATPKNCLKRRLK